MIISALIKAVFSVIVWIITFILDLIFTLFSSFAIPDFPNYAQYIETFWNTCFKMVGWLRSCFLIDAFSMEMIYLILLIKLTYKPVIALVKMFVHWFEKLKVGA